MPMSHYPHGFNHGVAIRNMPVLNTYSGNIYWVDSGAGSDGNKGTFDRPLATVDKAVSLCAANNGDTIMLKAGHAENVADATTFQVDKAGVSIIGLGTGSDRPTFTFTNTAGSVEVDSANTYIENVRLLASVSAVVVGVNVDADNCTLVDVEWDFDETGDDFLIMLDVVDASDCHVFGATFRAEEATAGAVKAVHLDNADGFRCVGSAAFGDFSDAVIKSDTDDDTGDAGNKSNGILIAHNVFQNDDTDNGACIDLDAAETGMIAYNALTTTGSTGVGAALDPGSCIPVENYASSQADRSASLVPATADTIA